LKLPRTIRLDPSDTFVFDRAAEPGEWAVSGAYLFWDRAVASFDGKMRNAFRSGLLGVSSFGWSTLAIVTEAEGDDRDRAVETLAHRLHEHAGAPDLAAARAAAEREIAFAASLCDHPAQTLIAVRRTWDGEDIREQFRTLRPRDIGDGKVQHNRVFAFLETDDPEGFADEVDLAELARGPSP
jgi:hypothetical protein